VTPSLVAIRPNHGEDGFTLLELIIVMALFSVVLSLAAAGLMNLTEATRSTEERSFADTQLRNVVEELARSIRAANPVDVQSPVSLYDRQISFETFCTPVGANCGADNFRRTVYRVISNRLEASVAGAGFTTLLGPSATSGLPLASRQFAIVNSVDEPIFTYIKADRNPLRSGGLDPHPGERFRDCTSAVRVHLRMITEPGNTGAPADLETIVTLRNFNKVSECRTLE